MGCKSTDVVLDNARDALGEFCINECNAYCCRKGYLVLTPKEMEITMQDKKKEFLKKRFLKKMSDGNFSLYFNPQGCPSLKNNLCRIHKNSLRSNTCSEFPISVTNNVIYISKRCLAGKTNFFYPFVSELISLGCKLEPD